MKTEIDFFQDLNGAIVINIDNLYQTLFPDNYYLAVVLASRLDAMFKDAFMEFYKSAIEQDDKNKIKLIECVRDIKK